MRILLKTKHAASTYILTFLNSLYKRASHDLLDDDVMIYSLHIVLLMSRTHMRESHKVLVLLETPQGWALIYQEHVCSPSHLISS